jgi:beta-galactosidase
MDVKYEPGTVVVALMTMVKLLLEEVHTAGKPYQIVLDADRKQSLLMAMIYLCHRICS